MEDERLTARIELQAGVVKKWPSTGKYMATLQSTKDRSPPVVKKLAYIQKADVWFYEDGSVVYDHVITDYKLTF